MLPQLEWMYVGPISSLFVSLYGIILLLRPCAVTCRTIGSAAHWSRSPRFVGYASCAPVLPLRYVGCTPYRPSLMPQGASFRQCVGCS